MSTPPTVIDFQTARRAKVLSVDPNGIARPDLDGEGDRPGVFRWLRSFDHRGLGADELATRTLALLTPTVAEGGPAGVLEAHIAHFRAIRRGVPVAKPAPAAPPEAVAVLVAEADAVLRHQVSMYGVAYDLGNPIDWEHHYPGNAHAGNDINRFHFLTPLVGAWRATGRRHYAEKAVALILDWITSTDICDSFIPGPDPTKWLLSCKSPYVWLSHLEPALHLVTWSKALAALLPEIPDLVSPNQFLQILKSVHDQLVWLELIAPEGGHGNGMVTGAACQLETLAYFPAFRHGPDVIRVAWERLDATLALQILPDGAQNELTPHYHCCVLEGALNTLALAPHLAVPPPTQLRERTRGMLLYLRHLVTPDGALVAFNDGEGASGGFARALLSRAESRELLGADGASALHSACFPYAGVMTLRQGSQRGRDELYLAFDGGPFGRVHQHEDMLSFWLSAYGRSFIVDPGRHMYDSSEKSFYPYLITTRAHSTIRVDDCDQNARSEPSTWVARAPLPLLWRELADGSRLAGATYDLGYGPTRIAVRHTRRIRFVPEPGYWVVEDELEGTGEHDIESRFQFAPGDLHIADNMAHTGFSDANLALIFQPDDWDRVLVEKGQLQPRAGWYSNLMQHLEPAPALVLHAHRRPLPWRTCVVLWPHRSTTLPEADRRRALAACATAIRDMDGATANA